MSSLPTGLPPLPKSLHGVVIPAPLPRSRSESPRESNRSYSAFKTQTGSPRNRPANLVVQNGQIRLTDTGRGSAESLDSALAFLRHEMAGLRQMDSALLGQLCSLNDAIQEVKLQLEPDTTSTCSSRSLDHITEGEEYESPFTPQRIYENTPRNGVAKGRTWSLREEDDEEEYMEPRDWRGSTGGVSPHHSTPRWNPPPCLSLELLSLPPPPPLPLSSPPHSPPIPTSPEYVPIQRAESRRSSAGSTGSGSRRRSGSKSSQGSIGEDRRMKWPGYLLNSSTSYESAC